MDLSDRDSCYRAVQSRDARFDGWFFIAVTSTHIYCRPSCSATTPKRDNVRFYPTAAAAQGAGFRACKRCRPDATPGSPEWNMRTDLTARAMRLIADGVIDRDGVGGLARRLGYSERHLTRVLTAEVGAGPLALARAQRAQTARTLIETTDLPFTGAAFAAGFASIRQFNDTVRDVFAATPSQLRARSSTATTRTAGHLTLRLPYRWPLESTGLLDFLSHRCVPGVEEVVDGTYRRTLRLAHGNGVVALTPADGFVACSLRLVDLRDLAMATQRCRRLLDLDADPVAVSDALRTDRLLTPLVRSAPGRRSPGHVDGDELAVRAVVGQQVNVAGARTIAARLVLTIDDRLAEPDGSLTHLFPSAAALATLPATAYPMPRARAATIARLTDALASGAVVIDHGVDRDELTAKLLALPGIGPWTASYIRMRALGDPDVFLPTDLGVRHALVRLGADGDPGSASARSEAWRPWRSYALAHLWASLSITRPPGKGPTT